MNLSREDYDLLQQIYDRLTQMQAESQELRAILKQERETAELQQAQTMRSKPKQVENPDSCIKQKENDDRSGWVPKKKETDDSEAEEYHYVSLGNLVEQVADQKHEVSTVDSLTENPKMDVCDDDSELLMLTQDRFELVDIQNQNTGSEITQGCQFSYTRRARKNLGVRKILVKRRYHRARKKKSTKYISRPELAQVLKCYGMFRNSVCIDRLENRKAERAYSKGRRSMVDIGVKRGPYLFGYEFQSQDSIKPLTHEPLMMEEAHSDFMVQNKVLEDAGIPEQMCLSSKYNGKFGLGFILHGLLNPGSHDVIRMVKIERDSMGHNEFTKAGRELREGDIYAEHYGKRSQELSHFGGKKRERDREFQGTTRPNKRKEWDSILIDGLSYELEEMSKFKGCDEFSYFQQQSSQHAQMHKGNKRLLLQEGENESCGLINSNENGGFIMDLNVIRLKLLLCLDVDRNKLIEWLDVHKSENQSQENVRAKVSRQAKSTTGEFKLPLHHVLKTGELIFSCDMLALLLKLCIIIHLEDKVSFSEASKGINKGLVCDKENKKLRNMEDRDKKEKNRTSGYIMTVVLSGLRTLCFLQGAAKREAHRMLLVKDISPYLRPQTEVKHHCVGDQIHDKQQATRLEASVQNITVICYELGVYKPDWEKGKYVAASYSLEQGLLNKNGCLVLPMRSPFSPKFLEQLHASAVGGYEGALKTHSKRLSVPGKLPVMVLGLKMKIRTLQGQLIVGGDDLGNTETMLMTYELGIEVINFFEIAGSEFQGKKLFGSYELSLLVSCRILNLSTTQGEGRVVEDDMAVMQAWLICKREPLSDLLTQFLDCNLEDKVSSFGGSIDRLRLPIALMRKKARTKGRRARDVLKKKVESG